MIRTKHQSASQDRAIPGRPDAENRDPRDFYRTPMWATEALLAREKFKGKVWEPACGDGTMSLVMKKYGLNVFSSDLIDRGYGVSGVDFLKPQSRRFDHIITNPPFKLITEFAVVALQIARCKVAMIGRLLWLEGKARQKFFKNSPLARVYVFSERVDISRSDHTPRADGKGGMTAFAWYVWEHGYVGHPELHWI